MTSGAGNMENIIEDAYYSFTTPSGFSTNDANFQTCVLSSCGGGNVDWLIWQLYESTGTYCISSGNLDGNLQLGGIGCGSTYVLRYMWEPVNCNYSNFAPFIDNYQSTACVLPIELLSFTGETISNKNILNWKTATETNNNHFSIERSIDGSNFFEIGVVNGSDNSTVTKSYSYTDISFANSINYYRLKQVDNNGAFKYFSIIAIDNITVRPILVKRINTLGETIQDGYEGMYIELYSDGSYIKKCCNPK
jgi:hypothetical protein